MVGYRKVVVLFDYIVRSIEVSEIAVESTTFAIGVWGIPPRRPRATVVPAVPRAIHRDWRLGLCNRYDRPKDGNKKESFAHWNLPAHLAGVPQDRLILLPCDEIQTSWELISLAHLPLETL
jgi:hypothetical protein